MQLQKEMLKYGVILDENDVFIHLLTEQERNANAMFIPQISPNCES